MPWAKYRKKPVVVEAIQWDGQTDTMDAIAQLAGYATVSRVARDRLIVQTPQGETLANVGDWIVCLGEGHVYPVRRGIFEATYEGAE